MTIDLNVTINGAPRQITADPRLTLLEVLREQVLLTGTKEGCGVGECGTCVVLADGKPVTSCLILAGDADRFTPIHLSRELAGAISGAEFGIMEGCGHVMFYERPAEFNQRIAEFFSG